VDLIRVWCIHVWKHHNETPLYRKCTLRKKIKQIKEKKERNKRFVELGQAGGWWNFSFIARDMWGTMENRGPFLQFHYFNTDGTSLK
jgi:hypothetical protein